MTKKIEETVKTSKDYAPPEICLVKFDFVDVIMTSGIGVKDNVFTDDEITEWGV